MSPNEFQLRAVLRDGEGERINADAVIARAEAMAQARRDRRVRVASVAAVVAVVGGIGVVGGVALHGRGAHSKSAGDAASARSSTSSAGRNAANQPVASGGLNSAQRVSCPATAPHLLTPGGGGSGQFGTAGSLFSGPVAAIKICAYNQADGGPITGPGGRPANMVLTGQQATALAASLDGAAKVRRAMNCPMYRTSDGKTLAIIGVSTSGQAMKPIIVTVDQNACNQAITNGTAIRYNWSAPASLNPFIAGLRANPGGPIKVVPSNTVTGSPARS